MARSYRKVNSSIVLIRKALGALAAADGPEGRSYAFACGYAQNSLEGALEALAGYGDPGESEAFIEGYDAVSAIMEPIPFPEA